MPFKDLPTPDKQKATRCHDNYFDALFDEALDEMQKKKIRESNFKEPGKEQNNDSC